MRNIKLTVEYDGSRYEGWLSSQTHGKSKNGSISDKITEVLTQMENQPVEVIAAIRTEAGVHAYKQICTFKTESKKRTLEIKQYLNRYLPRDIAVLDCVECDERFHPGFAAKGFVFEYHLTVGEVPSVFDRKYNYYCFKKPQVKLMKEAANELLGSHDFAAFSDNKRMKKSTVREIRSIDIYDGGNEISVTIEGDDFWPNMVRNIVALLLSIGIGENDKSLIAKAFQEKNRNDLPEAIDAKGLFLAEVKYD